VAEASGLFAVVTCLRRTGRILCGVTLTRSQVRDLLGRFDIRPKRSLGQHFVVEPNTVRRIVELAEIGSGDRVLEVGPGLGALTLALLETGAEVTAVEVDDRLIEALKEVLVGRQGLRIVHADAMKIDWSHLLGEDSWSMVANLPYNISTPLICNLLEEVSAVSRFFVMVQLEVADRLVASPGDTAYGLPSVRVAYHANARKIMRVPSSVFWPRPRVESALVEIVRHQEAAVTADSDVLFRLVQAGFAQRRKMLRRSLRGLVEEEEIFAAGIDPTARAEDLELSEWAALAGVLT